VVVVVLPPILAAEAGGQSRVEVEATTVDVDRAFEEGARK